MPRYFFHLYDSIEVIDGEGQVLPDIDAARVHALAEARQMMAAELKAKGQINLGHWIEVEDEQQEVVLVMKFSEAVQVNPSTKVI